MLKVNKPKNPKSITVSMFGLNIPIIYIRSAKHVWLNNSKLRCPKYEKVFNGLEGNIHHADWDLVMSGRNSNYRDYGRQLEKQEDTSLIKSLLEVNKDLTFLGIQTEYIHTDVLNFIHEKILGNDNALGLKVLMFSSKI